MAERAGEKTPIRKRLSGKTLKSSQHGLRQTANTPQGCAANPSFAYKDLIICT